MDKNNLKLRIECHLKRDFTLKKKMLRLMKSIYQQMANLNIEK